MVPGSRAELWDIDFLLSAFSGMWKKRVKVSNSREQIKRNRGAMAYVAKNLETGNRVNIGEFLYVLQSSL